MLRSTRSSVAVRNSQPCCLALPRLSKTDFSRKRPLILIPYTREMESSQTSIGFFVRPTTHDVMDEPTVYVDPSGDIKLLVQAGEDQKTFVVSSKALCLASPVWRAMLDSKSRFKEASPSTGEVFLEDDDSEALWILLNIAHFRFLEVPQSLEYDQLLRVSILCDKYDIVTLVRPWLPKWIRGLKHLSCCAGYEEWLFIAWVFGDTSTFERIAYGLVLEIKVPLCGSYLTASGSLPTENLPPGTLGQWRIEIYPFQRFFWS